VNSRYASVCWKQDPSQETAEGEALTEETKRGRRSAGLRKVLRMGQAMGRGRAGSRSAGWNNRKGEGEAAAKVDINAIATEKAAARDDDAIAREQQDLLLLLRPFFA
jgi:hypothetical protein